MEGYLRKLEQEEAHARKTLLTIDSIYHEFKSPSSKICHRWLEGEEWTQGMYDAFRASFPQEDYSVTIIGRTPKGTLSVLPVQSGSIDPTYKRYYLIVSKRVCE